MVHSSKPFQATRWGKIFDKTMSSARKAPRHLLPAISSFSGDVVSSSGAIEAEHWKQLEFISASICHVCGTPLEVAPLPETLCGNCEVRQGPVNRTRSALAYSDVSKRMILNFKHAGRADHIEVFANWMKQAAPELLDTPAILVPVPLHVFRRIHRKFNQSALLGRALSRNTGLPMFPMVLRRIRHTPIQGFKSGSARAKNVKGAFEVPKNARHQIKAKRIILIDDVRTSGSTLNACAKALRKAGADEIDAITLARVVKPTEFST